MRLKFEKERKTEGKIASFFLDKTDVKMISPGIKEKNSLICRE